MTRILVTGSREYSGSWEDIAMHFPEDADATIIHGACSRKVRKGYGTRGFCTVEVSVDMLADFAARMLGFGVEPYPANWSLGKKAGPMRNERMLREGNPDRALAFGSLTKSAGPTKMAGLKPTGTGDMVGRLLAAGIPVRWIAKPNAEAIDLKLPHPVTP